MKQLASLLLFLCIFGSFSFAQNRALNLDGTDDYIQTSFSGISGSAARTVEAWIRTSANANPSNGGIQQIITDWGNSSTGARFTLNVLWSNALRIEVAGSGLSSTTSITDGNWHHVAVVYNPSAALNFRLFVDGTLDTAGNITTSVNTGTGNNLMIGRRVDGARFFEGSIDEVKVYNIALPDSIIQQNYQRSFCTNPSGLVAYYKFNEGFPGQSNTFATTALDYSGNGNTGTLNNFTLSGSSSNWVSGPTLNGGDSYATLTGSHCSLYAMPSGKYSVSQSGTYRDTLTNNAGCDSIIEVQVTIGNSRMNQTKVVCDSYTFLSGRVVYQNGLYYDTLYGANQNGCDSIILTQVTIKPSSTNYDTIAVCDSFMMPLGRVIRSSGWFVDTLIGANARGCDSIYGRLIHFNTSITGTSNMQVCDSVLLDGNWYTQSQTVLLQRTSQAGCDSIHSLDLTVLPSTSFQLVMAECDEYVSVTGKVYTSSGTFYDTLYAGNKFGCDSIILTQLTLHASSKKTVPVTACDSFVSNQNNVYHTSGNYTENYLSQHGCDSILVFNLTLLASSQYNYTKTDCDSTQVNGKWYSQNQTVTYTISAKNGCDSVISVNVVLTKIDRGVVQTGTLLVAKQKGAKSYLWRDCATSQIVANTASDTFVATYNGDYKVLIDYEGCKSQSDCYTVNSVGIEKLENLLDIRIVPNPNSGKFLIMLPETYSIHGYQVYDIRGKLVLNHNGKLSGPIQPNNALIPGVYMLLIHGDGFTRTMRIVVE